MSPGFVERYPSSTSGRFWRFENLANGTHFSLTSRVVHSGIRSFRVFVKLDNPLAGAETAEFIVAAGYGDVVSFLVGSWSSYLATPVLVAGQDESALVSNTSQIPIPPYIRIQANIAGFAGGVSGRVFIVAEGN